MADDLARARELLAAGSCTCALVCGEKEITSTERGVKPLLELYESGRDYSAYSAADKVIGNGAAFLYVLLGIKKIYCGVISADAKATLDSNGIEIIYGELVPAIINHDKTGFCPVETAVKGITEPQAALDAIKAQLRKMKII